MLIRNSGRTPEEASEIAALQLLRVFWEERFMQLELTAFHKAVRFYFDLLKEERALAGAGDGYSFDTKSSRAPKLDALLGKLESTGLLKTSWHGDRHVIEFNASTGHGVKRLLADGFALTAAENVPSLKCARDAIKYYKGEITSSGCDE